MNPEQVSRTPSWQTPSRPRSALLALIATLALCGCAVGPRAISVEHANYNDVLVRTSDEQLLRNLVRLRYRDRPLFLEVSSITSQIVVGGSGGTAVSPLADGPEESFGLKGSVSYKEQPVITYQPLSGSDFMTRFMLPVRLETLVQLSQSGWSIERILRICAQSMNGLPNAPTAAGPTPSTAPKFERFAQAATLFRKLQSEGVLSAGFGREGEALIPMLHINAADTRTDSKLKNVVGAGGPYIRLVPGLSSGGPQTLSVQTRSLNGMLHYLSHGVDIPPIHHNQGLVTQTAGSDGEFDWQRLTQGLLSVQSGTTRPVAAAVSIRYRDHWFWIADNDLDSKSTFSFLAQLLSLQSEAGDAPEPMLTIPLR